MALHSPFNIPCSLFLVLSFLPGCTSVVWFGRSPDRRLKVEVIQARNKLQTVKLDGKSGRPYDGIGVEALVFSPDSRRLAYPAQRGARWHVVVDGEEGEAFGGIGEIVFSPDSKHVAYLARRGGQWLMVRDGRAGAAFHGVFRRTLVYSADSQHLACAVMAGPGKSRVILDGKPGPIYQQVAALTFGPRGRLAYIGRHEGRAHMVLNHAQGPPYDEVSEVALGRGGRVAYLARRLRSWVAVVDGVEGKPYEVVAGLVLGPGGKHLAYAASQNERAFVVRDGVEGPRLDGIRVPTLGFTSTGEVVYVARQLGARGETAHYVVVHGVVPGPPFHKVLSLTTAAGGRWGYIGKDAAGYRVVLDGQPHKRHRWAANLVFGPGGKRHAFITRRAGQVAVNASGSKEVRFDVVVDGSLVFSRDGAHWGCVAGEREPRRLFLVMDGRTIAAFDREELTAAMMANPSRSTSELLRRWIIAEMELATGAKTKNQTPPKGRP